MRRILRRYVTRDPSGRAIFIRSERLTDDGTGRLQLNSEQTAHDCSGCQRPVTEASELRGMCDLCRYRECCAHCATRCQVCSRLLCGHCRQGFAGPPPVTVCASCRQGLIDRQIREDQLLAEQTIFDRHIAQHRLIHQAEALRLASERMRLMAQFQAARLGMNHRTKLQWAMLAARMAAVQTFRGIRYVVRRALP